MTKFLRIKDVINMTGLSRSTIYQNIADGKFPAQIKLGLRCVAWSSEEVNNWMLDCISNSRGNV